MKSLRLLMFSALLLPMLVIQQAHAQDVSSIAQRVSSTVSSLYSHARSRRFHTGYEERLIVDALAELDREARSFLYATGSHRPYGLYAEFSRLERSHRKLMVYEQVLLRDPLARRDLSYLRVQMDLLHRLIPHSPARPDFRFERVKSLAFEIENKATSFARNVEDELRRGYGRSMVFTREEAEALRAVHDLARAAQLLEREVSFRYASAQDTRALADDLFRKFDRAEYELSHLRRTSHYLLQEFRSLQRSIEELKSIYDFGRYPVPGPNPGYGPNNPFGRGGVDLGGFDYCTGPGCPAPMPTGRATAPSVRGGFL